MIDPLAGKREAIAAGEVEHLTWPDTGDGPPVTRGQIFQLRSCHVEIADVGRRRKEGSFIWLAMLRVEWLSSDRIRLLPRSPTSTEDYVSDPDKAAGLRPPEGYDQELIDHNFGHYPPEPEAVPKHEIPRYLGSKAARKRHEDEMIEGRLALEAEPIARRIARIEEAERNGAPVGRQLKAIFGQLAEAERKAGIRRAA